jgi:LmbE family N-acetylglucosaminyl deacetylase
MKLKLLYIFPHPDDESFGPAGAIHSQIKERHEVFLLTFTKGGATKVRHQLGLSVQQMGAVREKELQKVKTTLGISELTILDFCYETYQEMVKTTNVIERIGNQTFFELADEKFETPLSSLTEQINN